ncbi:MAG: glycosyltransferase [Candidatus Omnitrophica bacterium]|nr:glycosyltransferase [Candidatus Omnitrophota bacterium]
MINILYVSPFAHIGGGEMSILAVLKNLDRKKFRPFAVSYAEGPFIGKLKEAAVEPAVFKRGNLFSEPYVIWKMLRFIKKNKIDLVHVNSLDIRAAIASRIAGVAFIGHLRVIYPFSWRDRLFVRLSKLTIAVSDAAVREFCGKAGQCRDKFTVIPNCVDAPDNISPVALKEEFNLPKQAVAIGAVGRIDPMKGYEYFIEAAGLIKKEIPDSYFFIVGDTASSGLEINNYLNLLKKRIEELGIGNSFFFTGFRHDALSVIAGFDVLAVPSVELKAEKGKISEAFGRVAAEAMAAGVPAVASKVGGLEEIIEDGVSGTLVPAGDGRALASAVIALLKDPLKKEAIREQGILRFKGKYTVSAHLGSLENIYARALGIRKSSGLCSACGNHFFKVLESCPLGFSVLECDECGFAFVEPSPDAEFLKKSYSENYYEPWLKQQRRARIAMWKKRLSALDKYSGRKGSLLDVGCGEGLFLELAKLDGWEASGTELSAFAVKYAGEKLGFPIFEGQVEDIDFSGIKFDAVTLWHVLEHTKDPSAVLNKVRMLMKEDGVLLLALPNLDNKVYRFLYRVVKGKRQHLFSPHDRELHLNFFKKETITRLLEKSGFEVSAVLPDYGSLRWHEHLLNGINGLVYFFTGRMFFDALEIHAKPFKGTGLK